MLMERGFRDIDPENLRVATSAASTSARMEHDEEDFAINTCIVTSGVDGLVVEDSLVLTSLDSLYQVDEIVDVNRKPLMSCLEFIIRHARHGSGT